MKIKMLQQLVVVLLLILCLSSLASTIDLPQTGRTLAALSNPDLGELQVTPSRIPPGSPVQVTVTVRIQKHLDLPASLKLHRLDTGMRKSIAEIATFRDDGTMGDAVAGDRLYTAQVMLSADKPSSIGLAAIASYATPGTEQNSSFASIVKVVPGADTSGPWAVADGSNAVYRDKYGRALSEAKPRTAVPASPDAPVFKQETVFISPNQKYAGIVGSLHPNPGKVTAGQEAGPTGWEFRYQDVTGTLWTKTINKSDRHFFTSGGSVHISEDGGRVLLLEVGENDEEPMLWVYDRSGSVVLEEQVPLYAVDDARISGNGKYLMIDGTTLAPKGIQTKILVITIDSPKTRWIDTYPPGIIRSEERHENKLGGFDIYINNELRFSYPRKGVQP